MRPLIWVSKSMDKLAATLTAMGHPISADTVRKELVKLGFSRQSNRKADEGSKHPDRNAQFEYINKKVVAAQAKRQPVISVDTKKKELVGNFKNAGTDYRPKGEPRRVNVHDFEDKQLGKVVPYGVHDVTANAGFKKGKLVEAWHQVGGARTLQSLGKRAPKCSRTGRRRQALGHNPQGVVRHDEPVVANEVPALQATAQIGDDLEAPPAVVFQDVQINGLKIAGQGSEIDIAEHAGEFVSAGPGATAPGVGEAQSPSAREEAGR